MNLIEFSKTLLTKYQTEPNQNFRLNLVKFCVNWTNQKLNHLNRINWTNRTTHNLTKKTCRKTNFELKSMLPQKPDQSKISGSVLYNRSNQKPTIWTELPNRTWKRTCRKSQTLEYTQVTEKHDADDFEVPVIKSKQGKKKQIQIYLLMWINIPCVVDKHIHSKNGT